MLSFLDSSKKIKKRLTFTFKANADPLTAPYQELEVAETFYKSLYFSVTYEIAFQEKILNSLPQK